MLAYVLLRVPPKQSATVLNKLRQVSGVLEAAAVYGEVDLIAKVEAPDHDALDDLILDRIQSIPEVESTQTHIVISKLHWSVQGPA
ncbi:MAG: Lrp/AsnC ligand binding domain-containing protein [Deltaproteobacteria bacterium]|nr:Lrp/AsnC ligand binding domain-containing protein [Deltaproteobacteria bacterium]MBI3077987.1 Lrp/AsnC ligand binding domain-containing protein [Deltaproteobacteria bacterium]